MPSLQSFSAPPVPAQEFIQAPTEFPQIPDEILKRFKSAQQWQEDLDLWYKRLVNGVNDANDSVSSVANQTTAVTGDLIMQQGTLTVAITTLTNAMITADAILAQRIVTVSALSGVSSNIKVQNAPPGAPALNDYWVNNTDPMIPVTYKWNGASWVEVTTPISAAAVAAEQSARITADGYLEGKYSLTVIAGNVVTGMNITSASGPGTDISSVIFRATDFQIYNGLAGVTMFSVSGNLVNLAGTLTVSTSGKVFIGTGNYANADTSWYVDSSGQFSLKDKLTWNGTTLAISGTITATAGTIGGWTIGATTISSSNLTLNNVGQITAGIGNDIVYMSAADATYRFWVGNATSALATFRVTKEGVLTATGAIISNGGAGNNYFVTDASGTLFGASAAGYFLAADDGGFASLRSGYSGVTGTSGEWLSYATGASFLIQTIPLTATSGAIQLVATGRISCVNDGSVIPFLFTNGSDTWGLEIDTSGVIWFGSSSSAFDTNLKRSAANTLKTDDSFVVGTHLTVDGNTTLAGYLVSFGADDSAGAGYRWVRVPNA